ncbi:MAG: heavy metal-binding domain-containing protein, partial [Leptolyngbyaceae cyanobacterium SM2_3_12]|nr:heavy metal-binding domain-containing protein [Leptolyngbyaceae cyanobacterium SM2_3_12]
MIITTGPSVEGRQVIQYCGLVNGEAILGANIFKDFFAGVRDIVGGRSGAYEKSLRQARDTAIQEMVQAAQSLGADAVIAVD